MIRIALLAIILAIALAGEADAQVDACTQVANGATSDITAFTVCKRVTNATGLPLCAVSQVDSTQWASFYNNPPGGVTIADCSSASGGYCWGLNAYSEVGDGTTTARQSPTAVALPSGVSAWQVLDGSFSNDTRPRSCGIGNNGRAYCWGANDYGHIGDGTTTNRTAPTLVTLPSGVTSFSKLSAGSQHACAIGNNGRAYCWGNNNSGKLGDSTTTNQSSPVAVTLPSGVTSFSEVAVGPVHSCFVGNNGRAYCAGSNSSGQLGDGSYTSSSTAVAVTLPSGVTSFSKIVVGNSHACAIGNNNLAYCWGANGSGQLGDGTTTTRTSPVAVTLPSGVSSFSEVSAGRGDFSCALGNNGRAYCFGSNSSYQFGNGTGSPSNSSSPNLVPLPNGVSAVSGIASGDAMTCGIGNNGRAYCWGYGYVGNGAAIGGYAPTVVSLPSGTGKSLSTSSKGYAACGQFEVGTADCTSPWGTTYSNGTSGQLLSRWTTSNACSAGTGLPLCGGARGYVSCANGLLTCTTTYYGAISCASLTATSCSGSDCGGGTCPLC